MRQLHRLELMAHNQIIADFKALGERLQDLLTPEEKEIVRTAAVSGEFTRLHRQDFWQRVLEDDEAGPLYEHLAALRKFYRE